ncbi:MAG TPA: hypothetical protein VFA38_01540, partial [Nitrospirales bacterium]|nr:hypothetical protein [Nitrospirales bacterium]
DSLKCVKSAISLAKLERYETGWRLYGPGRSLVKEADTEAAWAGIGHVLAGVRTRDNLDFQIVAGAPACAQ